MENKLKLNAKTIGKNTFGTLIIPILFVAVILIICATSGKTLFSSKQIFANFVSYTAIITLTTLALSINLGSGRFDFSLGSMATLSAVISAKLTYSFMNGGDGSAFVMLIFCIIFGLILGLISGVLYVLLRIPPIITSLGVTLIYEGLSFVITNGIDISKEVQNTSMINFNASWLYPLIITILALAIIYYIYDRTKFGYEYKALKEGQLVAKNIGINEVKNAVICYAIAGALMGTVGFIQTARNTRIDSTVLNFGSISIMFTAFLPMFIGGFIGRFSNDKLGYFLAGICMSLLSSMFSLFTNVLSSSTQSIIQAVLLVAFLIYLNNENLIKDIVNLKHLKAYITGRKNNA